MSDFKPFTEEEKDQISVLYIRDRMSMRKIADKIGRHYNSVRHYIKTAKLDQKRNNNDRRVVNKIFAKINKDMVKGTADDLNICASFLDIMSKKLEKYKAEGRAEQFYEDLTMKEIGYIKLFTENIRKIHAIAKDSKEGKELNKEIEKVTVEFSNGYSPALINDSRFNKQKSQIESDDPEVIDDEDFDDYE